MARIDDICKPNFIENATEEELLTEYKNLRTQGDQAKFVNALYESGFGVAIFDFLTLTTFFQSKIIKDKTKRYYKLKTSAGETNYYVEYTGKITSEIKPYDDFPYNADNDKKYKTAVLIEIKKT